MLKRKLKYFKVLIIIFILTISFLGVIPFVFANPDDVTLYASADAYVKEAVPDGIFNDAMIYLKTQDVNRNQRGFLKFDLDSLPAGATISLATLRLYCVAVSALEAGVTDNEARRVADDSWTEDTLTWNNQKAYGDVEDTKVPAVSWVEFDVTSFVQVEWTNDKIVSFCLKNKVEGYDGSSRWYYYHSKEYNGLDPELYIEYTVVSDNAPFYSDVGSNGVMQVGESADFWVFWEDDFALEDCQFETNTTGISKNDTISVSGISSWANITLQLNFTANMRVEYRWFCMDNASQWNVTSFYFLVTTSLYITFNFNNSTMGKFKVDNVNTANETQNSYNYNESILLDGIQLSSDYSFLNFTWTGGNSLINNYDYYTSGNNTIWCYFGLSGVGGIDESYFVLGFVIAGCAILFIIIVLKSDKKEK